MTKGLNQKNIQIPLYLFIDIIELLQYLDTSNWDIPLKDLYDSILDQIRAKQDSIALRGLYSNIVFANDEQKQHAARMHYLQIKRIYNA